MTLVHSLGVLILSAALLTGQTALQPAPDNAEKEAQAPKLAQQVRNTYTLGAGDQITITAINAEEIPKEPVRISNEGFLSLPLVGRVKAAGLTLPQLEAEIVSRLKSYLKEPEVSLNLVEMRSQPVSVLGAVNKPGVYQLQGRKTLFEMISMSEGLRTDAGYVITITRSLDWGPLPLPDTTVDKVKRMSVGHVSVKSVMEAKNPDENILVQPDDVITVPKGELVYVVGEVKKPGGFVLNEHESMSVLQAVALAEGTLNTAAVANAKVLRSTEGPGPRQEVAVNLKQIMAGKAKDVPLRSEDILFIPNSAARSAFLRTLETGINVGTGIAIWRR
jgi:polysaccharide export outer membrane protein